MARIRTSAPFAAALLGPALACAVHRPAAESRGTRPEPGRAGAATATAAGGAPENAGPSPENTGPPFWRLTIHGRVRPGRADGPTADSVVFLDATPDCERSVLGVAGSFAFRNRGAPVVEGGQYSLPLTLASPTPCVRVAAVRAGRMGSAASVRAGPLAVRYNGSPPAPEDSAAVDLTAPPP